jgi:hypothetical protein
LPPPERNIETVEDVMNIGTGLIRLLLLGEIEPQKANTITSILSLILKQFNVEGAKPSLNTQTLKIRMDARGKVKSQELLVTQKQDEVVTQVLEASHDRDPPTLRPRVDLESHKAVLTYPQPKIAKLPRFGRSEAVELVSEIET